MRESLPHGFRSPHGDALISQLFLLMSAFCRFLRNLQKFAYSTIRSTICLVFSGLRSLPFSSLRSSSGTFSQDLPPFSFFPRERYHRFWCQDILSRSSQTPRQSWMSQSAQRSLLGTTEFQKLHGVHRQLNSVDSRPVVTFSCTFLWKTRRLWVILRLSSTPCVCALRTTHLFPSFLPFSFLLARGVCLVLCPTRLRFMCARYAP